MFLVLWFSGHEIHVVGLVPPFLSSPLAAATFTSSVERGSKQCATPYIRARGDLGPAAGYPATVFLYIAGFAICVSLSANISLPVPFLGVRPSTLVGLLKGGDVAFLGGHCPLTTFTLAAYPSSPLLTIDPQLLQKLEEARRASLQKASSQLADQLASLPFPDILPSDEGELDKAVFPEGFGQRKGPISSSGYGPLNDNLPQSAQSSATDLEQYLQSPFDNSAVYNSPGLEGLGPLPQPDSCQGPFQGLDGRDLPWTDDHSSSGVPKSSPTADDCTSTVLLPPAVDAEPLNSVHFSSSDADLWGMMTKIMEPSDAATLGVDTTGDDFPQTAGSTASPSYNLTIEEACPSRLQQAGGQKILMAVTGLQDFDFSSRYISVNIGGVLVDPHCVQNGVVSFMTPELASGNVRLTLIDTSSEEWIQLCEPITLTVESRQQRIAKAPVRINGQLDRHGQAVLIKQLLQKQSASDIMAMVR